ncbi:Polycomb group protein Psc [Amphibalanus amphitrite]|uniref:Polycomb group protein Psc n=1 Tax=Amphibalanus amphitrite TaxID=1232801 RepID=A0A6A4WJI5_AMPAM|nr:Polycomb group protein Psc [Amphibalanus amphitrite]
MSKTFADRRILVVTKRLSVPKLKKLYPALFQEMEIWAELARIRGGGSTKENELERARENLSKVLTKFQVCETNVALEHLLIELREEDALYAAPTAGGPMVIWRDALWVEGEKVADFEILNKIDQFLTWGAAFSVFAQKPTKKSTRCSAYLATVMVLQTDVLKPPKGLERITQPDQTLQSVVYKLVPRLFNEEMQRRRDFYKNQDHSLRDRSLSPERRGDVSSQQFVYTLTDPISFSLEFARSGIGGDERTDLPAVRYFQAPAGLGISQLKKLLRLKHGLGPRDAKVDILYKGQVVPDDLSVMDVACQYNWDRATPMAFFYRWTRKRGASTAASTGASTADPTAPPTKRSKNACAVPEARAVPVGALEEAAGVEAVAREKEEQQVDKKQDRLEGGARLGASPLREAGFKLSGASRPAAPAGGQPSAVPPSPRRSLASLPALRPIGAGAIPLMTGQLDQFLWLVSQSAVSHPNGSWRLPADASTLLSRATAPSQPASGKPIRPKPTQRKSVTIEKIRAAPASQPQPARPPNSPKLLAIAESLAMKQIQAAAGKTPPPVSAAPPPSALGSLLSLSQSQQLGVSRQPSAGDQSAARCRPVSGSAARRQIPNPALLHQQSQGRLTVLNVPPAEAAGTGSGSRLQHLVRLAGAHGEADQLAG